MDDLKIGSTEAMVDITIRWILVYYLVIFADFDIIDAVAVITANVGNFGFEAFNGISKNFHKIKIWIGASAEQSSPQTQKLTDNVGMSLEESQSIDLLASINGLFCISE